MVSLLVCATAVAQADVLQEAPVDLSNDMATELEAQLNDALENEENDTDNPVACCGRWAIYAYVDRDCPDPATNTGWEEHPDTEDGKAQVTQKCTMRSAESHQRVYVRGPEGSSAKVLKRDPCKNCHPNAHNENSGGTPTPGNGGGSVFSVSEVLTAEIPDLITRIDARSISEFKTPQLMEVLSQRLISFVCGKNSLLSI